MIIRSISATPVHIPYAAPVGPYIGRGGSGGTLGATALQTERAQKTIAYIEKHMTPEDIKTAQKKLQDLLHDQTPVG